MLCNGFAAAPPGTGRMAERLARSWLARPITDPALALACLIGLALAVGGGGVSAAFGNLAVQLFALAILAVHAPLAGAFARRGPRALLALLAASCLLPLAQLVPLPPVLWTVLPGRDLVAQSLALAGGPGWFPMSVAPARTLVAFLGVIAPATVVIVGCGLPPARLVALQVMLVVFGLVVALFGTTHLLDPRWGDLYASVRPLPGVLVGTFADRNAAALFLDVCLLFLVGLPDGRLSLSGKAVRATAGAFLALCVILTGSRTGMVLLAAPGFLLLWRLAGTVLSRSDRATSRPRLVWATGILLTIVVASLAVFSSERGQASLARFESGDEMRAEMREDAGFAAERYWPVGAGMGTFDEVFQIDESLEYVSPRTAGRAHMDYLELAIEAGLAGLLLAAAWLAWAGWSGSRSVQRPGAWPARAAALAIAAIALQSLLAFPLRSQAMLCVAALAVVLLARSPVSTTAREGDAR